MKRLITLFRLAFRKKSEQLDQFVARKSKWKLQTYAFYTIGALLLIVFSSFAVPSHFHNSLMFVVRCMLMMVVLLIWMVLVGTADF